MLSLLLEKNDGNLFSPIVRGEAEQGSIESLKFEGSSGLTLLGVVTIEVHVRLGCLGVSNDALDRISFRVGYIITTICARAIFRHCFLFFYGCMGVGFNFSFVVWASIFVAV